MADPVAWPTVALNGRRRCLASRAPSPPNAYEAHPQTTFSLFGCTPVPPPWEGASSVGVGVSDHYAVVVSIGRLAPHNLAAAHTS